MTLEPAKKSPTASKPSSTRATQWRKQTQETRHQTVILDVIKAARSATSQRASVEWACRRIARWLQPRTETRRSTEGPPASEAHPGPMV